MTRDFTVRVAYVYSERAAEVWREPDAEYPDGRMYGLPLARVVDAAGNFLSVNVGDVLTVRVEEDAPERIVLARFLEDARVGAPAFAHA